MLNFIHSSSVEAFAILLTFFIPLGLHSHTMDKKKLWNILKTIGKLCFTAAALYWVFRKVNISDLREALIDSNPLFLALAFLAYTGSIVIASSRLNGFFKGMGLILSERYNFKLYLLGSCYNLFLPGGVGGDG